MDNVIQIKDKKEIQSTPFWVISLKDVAKW